MRAINASVGAQITLHDAGPAAISALRRSLSFPNPEYETYHKFGETPPPTLPPKLCCVREFADGTISVPRGSIGTVQLALSTCGLRVEGFEDLRSVGSPLRPLPQVSLRDYQKAGVAELIRLVQGLVVLPCGAGKTTLGIAAIASLGRTALVVVHTLDLLQQWVADVERILGVKASAFGGGAHEIGDITVATVQSLFSRPDTDLSSFGFCIHDECHRAPARTSQEVLARCPARWRLGLTATPEREDGLSQLVEWSFGPVLLERSVPQLAKAGWLLLPQIIALETGFQFSCSDSLSTRKRTNLLRKTIVSDNRRNCFMADTISRECAGHTSLVLTNDKAHCAELAKLLKERGHDASVITSAVPKRERRRLLDALRDGSTLLVIATSLADEGLDVPRLSRVFLALPERSKGRTKQRAGRLMRPFGDQRARLIDFVDSLVPTLVNRWRSRRGAYRSLGLSIEDVTLSGLLPSFRTQPRAS